MAHEKMAIQAFKNNNLVDKLSDLNLGDVVMFLGDDNFYKFLGNIDGFLFKNMITNNIISKKIYNEAMYKLHKNSNKALLDYQIMRFINLERDIELNKMKLESTLELINQLFKNQLNGK